MKHKRMMIAFALYTFMLIPTSIFYMIADFGRGRTRIYGFVLLFICVLFCISKFSPEVTFPYLAISALAQVPAILLYFSGATGHFNWQGVAHSLDANIWGIVHTLFFLFGTLLACAGWKGWRWLAAPWKKEDGPDGGGA